jgi:AcrR family transcriptional regulator
MGTAERRAREKDDLRRAILDAARELFATEDYEAVTMRRIARKIEYSPTAIYLHFREKDEILLYLINEGFGILGAHMEGIQSDDPKERLRQIGRIYFEFAWTQPHYYRLMFQLPRRREECEEVPAECENGPRVFELLCTRVSEAMAAGQFRSDVPAYILGNTIWAAVHGAASLGLSGHLEKLPAEDHAAFYENVLDTIFRGCAADP